MRTLRLKIEVYLHPELSVAHQVRELERVCQAHDQLKGSLLLDPSMNVSPEAPCLIAAYEEDLLIGAMVFFAPTLEEAELVALTHPDYRRRGVFRSLLSATAEQAKTLGIPGFLLVCEPQSTDGVAALSCFPLRLDHTEYALRYDQSLPPDRLAIPEGLTLHRATHADLSDMSRISAESFSEEPEHAAHFLALALESETRRQYIARLNGEPVAIGALGYENGEATLFGLGVLTSQQNRGIGRGLVALLLREALAQKASGILIEVDNTNARAYHLYLSCGFFAEAIYDYWRGSIDQFLPK